MPLTFELALAISLRVHVARMVRTRGFGSGNYSADFFGHVYDYHVLGPLG